MEENTPQQTNQEEEILLTWKAPIRPHHERSKRWYTIAGSFVGLCMLWSIFTRSWTFTVLIGLLSAVYYIEHKKVLPDKQMILTNRGFQIGDKYTPWLDCVGFWMLQGPGYIELHIERKTRISGVARIQLGDMDFVQVRETIAQFIPEFTDKQESALDMIIRLLKI